MKGSEYIKRLQFLVDTFGDLEVETWVYSRKPAPRPDLGYRKILKGRERTPEFWDTWHEEDQKGERVIKV